MAAMALALACNGKTAGDGKKDKLATDSVKMEKTKKGVSITVKADYPVGNEALLEQVASFVGGQMFYTEDTEAQVVLPPFKGDFKAFLKACTQKRWDELYAYTYEDGPVAFEGDRTMPITSAEYTFRKVFEDEHCATWQCRWYYYIANAARPNMAVHGMTVCKKTGKPLDHTLLKDTDSQAFGQLLKECARQALANELEETIDSDNKLKEYILGDNDIDRLPLPLMPPYLTADGVALPYQDFELFPMHDALVVVLPYDKVGLFLNLPLQ